MDFSFHKGERLSSNKLITALFQSGRSVGSYPIRIIYSRNENGNYPASVAVSVPKRLFKRAVDRNLLKRRIREAYRLNKPVFYASLREAGVCLNLVIQYQQKERVDFHTIQSGLRKGLEKMMIQINE